MKRNIAGANVMRIRCEQELSVSELARRLSNAGYPTQRKHMFNIENGFCKITDFDLFYLAKVLQVSPLELLREQPGESEETE